MLNHSYRAILNLIACFFVTLGRVSGARSAGDAQTPDGYDDAAASVIRRQRMMATMRTLLKVVDRAHRRWMDAIVRDQAYAAPLRALAAGSGVAPVDCRNPLLRAAVNACVRVCVVTHLHMAHALEYAVARALGRTVAQCSSFMTPVMPLSALSMLVTRTANCPEAGDFYGGLRSCAAQWQRDQNALHERDLEGVQYGAALPERPGPAGPSYRSLLCYLADHAAGEGTCPAALCD